MARQNAFQQANGRERNALVLQGDGYDGTASHRLLNMDLSRSRLYRFSPADANVSLGNWVLSPGA